MSHLTRKWNPTSGHRVNTQKTGTVTHSETAPHAKDAHPAYAQQMDKLDTAGAAKLVGVAPPTIRSWQSRRRPAGCPFPKPDGWGFELQRPWWYRDTITDWVTRRAEQRRLAGIPTPSQ